MTDVRANLKQLMRQTDADSAHWRYHAVRPMRVPPTWHPGQYVEGDCSKGVQFLCRWGKAPDPMGNNWSSFGNSTTIALHLRHVITPDQLEVGDIITFGSYGQEHAAMVLEAGHDPLLWSFGHQGAPNTYRLSQDRRQRQYLKLPVPSYVATPQDKLRAETGWFAWVAWKLGEGHWRAYKPADKRVRPNVKKVIPLKWWRRYALYLKNRNKANTKLS